MKYTFTIDVPTLYDVVQNQYEVGLIVSCVEAVGSLKDAVLAVSEKSYAETFCMDFHLCRICANLSFCYYDSSKRKNGLITFPDVITTIIDDGRKVEEYLLCCYLHEVQPKGNGIFIVHPSRWSNAKMKTLQTTRDKKTVDHPVILLSDGYSFDTFIQKNNPKFVQHKHGSKEYKLSGKVVSPFSATPEEGEELLRNAFADAQIPDDVMFPDRLYTWNKHANLYVEFRRSSGDNTVNEYHGFDLKKGYWQSVPDYIKKIYHHW